ncbi:hypothetical protein ELQ92_08505 [Labedella populi]|uniref:Putative Flp pilus-assembly TadG-like N-terminal domain-containing protein n=1 Tax=Labedella populi TaxID=2498850 RepID=A0A3S3ZJU0_9MICO|nr:pilus assembly protein TadG-related protein [Labedella populi]RWZ61079.1 hypothetical protein ELQ92_08505 [Labedella populi]
MKQAEILARVADRERGSTLVLTIGFAAFAIVVTLVVAAATSLYIERKRLLGLADSAALVGAEAFDLAAVEPDPDGGVSVRLDAGAVEEAVDGFVADVGTSRFDRLRIESATTLDGRSATVTLSSAWSPPVLTLLLPEGIRLDATSTARAVLQ